ncbi:nitroreductase/quinone reductase family protein [Amycolatopsis sp. NPDC059021]|uniref:nitroreductase/quinone reductase family protein n=1 Tax=Amycolatopsis sp. NPDC059021 TaxID=3346704 RepID=UPI00366BB94A
MTEEKPSETFDAGAFQRRVIDEFRANAGKVALFGEDASLALVTTTGARSGLPRTVPLSYVDVKGQKVIVASAMGAPRNPAWYHNIRKNARVTVETGTETFEALAAIPDGPERDALFAEVVAIEPGFGEYQAKTTRPIPVVTLHHLDEGADRVRGMGDFVVDAHDWLRKELAELRGQADEIADGKATTFTRTADLGRELREHCLTFCGALKRHHLGEDTVAFPMLAARFPSLAPALEKLAAEHVVVARAQERIRELVEGYVPGEGDPVRLREELDRLATDLEAHFAYEERSIVTALNALAPAPDIP